jgi:glycosyltransferase involved in cell wall biosynthesis
VRTEPEPSAGSHILIIVIAINVPELTTAVRNVSHGCAPAAEIEGIRLLLGYRIAVVLPAYNAANTLRQTFAEIPHDIVDEVILTDDHSRDDTPTIARELGIQTLEHESNRGYGGNQKTCYAAALARGADIVVMLHPDYQYTPKLVTAMASMIASDQYDVVLGSRILGRGALAGGMPIYKYIFNRLLTLIENVLVGQKLSEYHTGYRAWSRRVLEALPIILCSEDFVFDNEMLAQSIYAGFRIGEISCPTKYFPEASSINFRRSVIYGIGVLRTAVRFRLHRWGVVRSPIFAPLDTSGGLPEVAKSPELAR